MSVLDREELIAAIRSEANGLTDSGFPIKALPVKVQSIALDYVTHENFLIEYVVTSMLSCASTALGGVRRIHVKGSWTSNAVLYFILVGRPGLGKTPPLDAVFRPIADIDAEELKAYARVKLEYTLIKYDGLN